jgi:hypothetical protein
MTNMSKISCDRDNDVCDRRLVVNYASHVPNREVTAGQSSAVSSVEVRAIIRARRRRDHIFPANLFADPAWDMLLELYAACLEQHRVTTTTLCLSAAVPPTTALRWIGTLEQQGLVTKQGDRFDARRVFIELSVTGKNMIERYFHGGQYAY